MKRIGRAWILLPAAIVVMVVGGLLVSNFQKEVGIAAPNRGGRAAVALAVAARDLSSGTGSTDYTAFSRALLAAMISRRNVPLTNPADVRLQHLLTEALDCLAVSREAWQAEIERTWDPETQGTPGYWTTLHLAVEISGDGPLTADAIRETGREQATEYLEKAIDLAG
jgi:hypothetical protein